MCPHCILGTIKIILLTIATVSAYYVYAGTTVANVVLKWRKR